MNQQSSDTDVTTEWNTGLTSDCYQGSMYVKQKDACILKVFHKTFPRGYKWGLCESSMRYESKRGRGRDKVGSGSLSSRMFRILHYKEQDKNPSSHDEYETEQPGKPAGRGAWGQVRPVSPRPWGHGGRVLGQWPGHPQCDHQSPSCRQGRGRRCLWH